MQTVAQARLDTGGLASDKRRMLLRPAGPDDLAAAADLINGAYRGDTARLGWTHEADLVGGRRTDATALRAMLSGGRVLLVGTIDGDASAPLIAAVLLEPAGAGICHLGMLTVRPDRQAEGIGRQLLDLAERAAAAGGAQTVRIDVISLRAELVAWYERRGYVTVGRAAFPYEAAGVEPFRDDLDFVVMEKPLTPGRAAPEA